MPSFVTLCLILRLPLAASTFAARPFPGGISAQVAVAECAAPVPALALAQPPEPRSRFIVFLLVGQSNMAGRGVVAELDRTPNPRVLAYLRPGAWVPAVEPLHRDKRTAGVGPGFAFARALLPSLSTETSVGLIPAAFGGSAIAKWRRGYAGPDRWPNGQTYFEYAVASARAAKSQGVLGAILWNQGEADGSRAQRDGGASYRRELEALVAEFREALGEPDLPFVAATLGPWHRADMPCLNQVDLELPRRVPHTAVVDTLSPGLRGKLVNKSEDPPHYDTPSARLLGAAYAEAVGPLLRSSSDNR
jgi:hypothetical protein